MFFIARRIDASLGLTTPPDQCCNCGAAGELDYVETPMKQVLYLFVVGTELTITEHFPYCPRCRRTAARVRHGWAGKLLGACAVSAAVFLAFVIAAESLPPLLSSSLFTSAVVTGFLGTGLYFYWLDWSRKGRTHYQPVALAGASTDGRGPYRLKFYNPRYAALVRDANPELVQSGVLRIET